MARMNETSCFLHDDGHSTFRQVFLSTLLFMFLLAVPLVAHSNVVGTSIAGLQFNLPAGWKVYERSLHIDYPRQRSIIVLKIVPSATKETDWLSKTAPVLIYREPINEALDEKSWLKSLVSKDAKIVEEEAINFKNLPAINFESENPSDKSKTSQIVFTKGSYRYAVIAHHRYRDAPTLYRTILDTLQVESLPADNRVAPTAVPPLQPTVHIIYLVPKGLTFKSIYRTSLKRSIQNLEQWYDREMRPRKTFLLAKPIVRVYTTPHTAKWYSTNNERGDQTFWENVLADGFQLTGGSFDDPEARWIFYIDAYAGCNQIGGAGTSGVVVIGRQDLRGFTGKPILNPCTGQTTPAAPICRWVGGMGHEVGHAFNLPHPPGCDDNDPETPCDSETIMYTGLYNYPNCNLLSTERQILEGSPFFVNLEVNPLFDCARLLSAPNRTRVALRIWNSDDNAAASINGVDILKAGFGEDTGFVDITHQLVTGRNPVRLKLTNAAGGWTYRFQVVKNGSIIFDRSCGVAGSQGCNDNDQAVGTVFDQTIFVYLP